MKHHERRLKEIGEIKRPKRRRRVPPAVPEPPTPALAAFPPSHFDDRPAEQVIKDAHMGQPLVFLYTENANIEPADLDTLRKAGFVPVRVKTFDDVRVVDPVMAGDRSVILAAAMEAIHKADGTNGPKMLLGKFLSAKFLETPQSVEVK